MKQLFVFLVIAMTTVTLAGCASKLSGESFSREEARKPQRVQFAVVEYVRPVVIEGTKTPIGAGAGAAVGGIAGSTLGEGKGSKIGAVLGSVVGGLVGAAAEEALTREQGVEITIRLENGKVIAVVQVAIENETFAVGDKVRVLTIGGTTRIAH